MFHIFFFLFTNFFTKRSTTKTVQFFLTSADEVEYCRKSVFKFAHRIMRKLLSYKKTCVSWERKESHGSGLTEFGSDFLRTVGRSVLVVDPFFCQGYNSDPVILHILFILGRIRVQIDRFRIRLHDPTAGCASHEKQLTRVRLFRKNC